MKFSLYSVSLFRLKLSVKDVTQVTQVSVYSRRFYFKAFWLQVLYCAFQVSTKFKAVRVKKQSLVQKTFCFTVENTAFQSDQEEKKVCRCCQTAISTDTFFSPIPTCDFSITWVSNKTSNRKCIISCAVLVSSPGVPNLFTISYHLGNPYCQPVPLLLEQLFWSFLSLFRRIIYIRITMKDHNYIQWDFCLPSTKWSMRGVNLLTAHRKS